MNQHKPAARSLHPRITFIDRRVAAVAFRVRRWLRRTFVGEPELTPTPAQCGGCNGWPDVVPATPGRWMIRCQCGAVAVGDISVFARWSATQANRRAWRVTQELARAYREPAPEAAIHNILRLEKLR